MRIACVSDTHLQRPWIPDADLFIHAGDLTTDGSYGQVEDAARWIKCLPHKRKIVIAGNHDWLFQRDPGAAQRLLGEGVTYLEDSGCQIDGIRFYGSPWTPYWEALAFNLQRGELWQKWDLIPERTDVLITHGPPLRVHDKCRPDSEPLGCAELRTYVEALNPRLHLFGHIHPGFGVMHANGTLFANVAYCRDDGRFNAPVVIEI